MKVKITKKTTASTKAKPPSYVSVLKTLTDHGFEFSESHKSTELFLNKLLAKYLNGEIISDSEARNTLRVIESHTTEIKDNFTTEKYIENSINRGTTKVADILTCGEGTLFTQETRESFVRDTLPGLLDIVMTDNDIVDCKIDILQNILTGCTINKKESFIEYKGEKLFPVTSYNSNVLRNIKDRLDKESDLKLIFLGTPDVGRKSVELHKIITTYESRIFQI